MTTQQLDITIANLGKTLQHKPDQFESEAKKMAIGITGQDIPHLQLRFQYPPAHPKDGQNPSWAYGQWKAICQATCFELIYNINPAPIEFIKETAFEKTGWPQANALDTLARWYVDGKMPESIVTEINERLPNMSNDTHGYFGRSLTTRGTRNDAFNKLLDKFDCTTFKEAVENLYRR